MFSSLVNNTSERERNVEYIITRSGISLFTAGLVSSPKSTLRELAQTFSHPVLFKTKARPALHFMLN